MFEIYNMINIYKFFSVDIEIGDFYIYKNV